jgi:hypothetical protein
MSSRSTTVARDSYVETLRARLELWDAELAQLEAKALARTELAPDVAELRRLRNAAADHTRKVASAGNPDWEVLRDVAEKDFAALGDAFGRARVRFGE